MAKKESINELRKLSNIEREKVLIDLYDELLLLRSKNSMGGSVDDPSRIKMVKKAIAKIKTINNEDKLGIRVTQ